MDDLIGKIRELAGAAGQAVGYLDHVATYTHINGEFLSTTRPAESTIEEGHGDNLPNNLVIPVRNDHDRMTTYKSRYGKLAGTRQLDEHR